MGLTALLPFNPPRRRGPTVESICPAPFTFLVVSTLRVGQHGDPLITGSRHQKEMSALRRASLRSSPTRFQSSTCSSSEIAASGRA